MLNSTRRIAVAAAASILLGSTALAGCSSGSNETVTHNPPLSTVGGKSTARSAVQTAILVTETSNGLAFPGGPTPAAIGRRVLDIMSGRRISAVFSACTNGTKTSQVTNADGSTTTTTDIYYDPLCTTLEEEQVLNVATPGSSTTSATGKVTTYDRSANVTSSHSFTISAANAAGTQTVTYNDAAAPTLGGGAIAAVGATCQGAPNSATMTCSAAMYGTTTTSTFGQAIADTGTAGTGGANNSVAVNVTYYAGGITGIAQSLNTWGVSGATGFNSATGAYSFSSTGSTGNGTFSLTDSLYTYTVTGNLTSTGLAVTIVRNTDPIATATVDPAGNGVINYADGTMDVIWGEVVGV
jgi:hypothetical protein